MILGARAALAPVWGRVPKVVATKKTIKARNHSPFWELFFELFVNREVGSSTHSQWVQPADSILIAGMYIHALPVTQLYVDGFKGWWTYTDSLYESIKTHKFLRDRLLQPRDLLYRDPASNQTDADQGIRIPAPGQRRTASLPPPDSSASVST